MPVTQIAVNGLIHLVTDHKTQPTEAWLLCPNATEPDKTYKALGYDSQVVEFHEPRLVLDPSTLVGPVPGFLKKGLACHQADWMYADLRNRHLDVGNGLTLGLSADRTPNGPHSVDRVVDLDNLIRTGNVICEAPLAADLFNTSYQPAQGTYPRLVARARLHAGHIQGGPYYPGGDGHPLQVGFHNSHHPPRPVAREILIRFEGGPLTIGIRDLEDADDPGTTLSFRSDKDVRIILENAGDCYGPESYDFLGHYMLRNWPSGNTDHPLPDTGGKPGNNPQCSPTEGQRP